MKIQLLFILLFAYQEHPIAIADFTKVRISARIKSENISDGVGEIYCYTKNGQQWLDYKTSTKEAVSGTEDWKTISAELWLNPKAKTLRIGATLSGSGSLWIDDFKIESIAAHRRGASYLGYDIEND